MCLGTFDAPLAGTRTIQLVKNGAEKAAAPTHVEEATTVNELLVQALSASQTAPNRAVKRRVRQRLHKKLGAICNKEEFDDAMEQFKVMETQQEKPKRGGRRGNETNKGASPSQPQPRSVKDKTVNVPPPPAPPAKPAANPTLLPKAPKSQAPPVPPVKTQIVAVPIFYQANGPSAVTFVPLAGPAAICAVQSVQPVLEKVDVATESVDLKTIEQQVSTTEDESELSSISSEEPPKVLRTFPEWSTPLPVERTFIQFSTRAYIARRRSRSQ